MAGALSYYCRQRPAAAVFSSTASTCFDIGRTHHSDQSINNTLTNQPHHATNHVRLPHILPPCTRHNQPQHHHSDQTFRRPTLQHRSLKTSRRRLDPHHSQKGPAGRAVRQQQGCKRVSSNYALICFSRAPTLTPTQGAEPRTPAATLHARRTRRAARARRSRSSLSRQCRSVWRTREEVRVFKSKNDDTGRLSWQLL